MGTSRVVVVLSRLGSGAGAEATLTDVCQAILTAGGHCVLLVGKSTWTQRARLRRFLSTGSACASGKARVISSARLLDFRVSSSVRLMDVLARKVSLVSLRFVLDPRRILAYYFLSLAHHVLVGQVLTARGVSELRAMTAKGVITLNHNGEPDDFSSQWRLLRPATKSVPVQSYIQYLQAFDRVLFQNEGQRRGFEAFGYPSVGQTEVIWPSCNESAARRAAAEPNPYDSSLVNLVCVAKFQPSKKQLELIKAFGEVLPKYPSTHLTLVGDSIKDKSYLMECQRYVAENNLNDLVEFVGYREDALRYIAHSDVFVLVSEGEGTSRAVREAVFLGTPIVSRKLEGVESFLGAEGAFWALGDDVRSALEEVLQGTDKRTRVAEFAHGRYAELATETKFFAAVRSFFGLGEIPEP